MTRERAKTLAPVLSQFGEGKTVQYYCERLKAWVDMSEDVAFMTGTEYRIKPEPRTVDWDSPEDVPMPVCWLKTPMGNMSAIIHVANEGVSTIAKCGDVLTYRNYRWSELAGEQYSTDGKTWKPCQKEAL